MSTATSAQPVQRRREGVGEEPRDVVEAASCGCRPTAAARIASIDDRCATSVGSGDRVRISDRWVATRW